MHGHRVVDERLGGGSLGPATGVLERLRQVPVVEGRGRAHPGREQAVDQAVVVVETRGSTGPRPVGCTRGQAIEKRYQLDAEPGHERDVVVDAVVGVARLQPVAAVAHGTVAAGEGVPDRDATAVLGGAALDLVGRRGRAEGEAAGAKDLVEGAHPENLERPAS